MKIYKIIQIIFIVVLLWQNLIYTQPYIYKLSFNYEHFDPEDSSISTTFSDIYRINLNNNVEEIYLRNIPNVNYQYYDNDNLLTWDDLYLYIKIKDGIRILSTKDTTNFAEFYLSNNITEIKYIKTKGLIYLTYEVSNSMDSISIFISKYAYINPQSWVIDTTNLYPSWIWYSSDSTMGYSQQRTFAPFDTLYLLKYSTDSFELIDKISLENTTSGITPCKLIHDIVNDIALINYYYPNCRDHSDCRYVVYNIKEQTIVDDFSLPFRSKALLTKDGKYVLALEYPYSPDTNGDYPSGKILIRDIFKGRPVKEFQLPARGELYLFNKYPDKFFYYIHDTKEAINIDINKLLTRLNVNIISPAMTLVNPGSFTIEVKGTGFTTNSVVYFNGNARTTTFVADTLLNAQILSTDVSAAGNYPVWVSDGTTNSDTLTFTVVSTLPKPVRPVLECVRNNGDGTYTAFFGYKNENDVSVYIPVGNKNKFTPTPQDRGQTRVFLPGRKYKVFTVNFNGSNLVWTLNGRTSTASSNSAPCN